MNTAPSHPPTVLIVDDDPESLLLVRTMVEYVGYRPATAATYEETIALLAENPAALVLDLVMPDQTSERIIDTLRETANRVPVVLMSAAMRDRLGAQAADYARSGVNVVSTLAKPFWVDVLITALEQAMPDAPVAPIVSP
jgi:CheY-like chemotaxis protein